MAEGKAGLLGSTQEVAIPMERRALSGLWDAAPHPRAVAVIAHGAGNSMRHPFFAGVARSLTEGRTSVLRFNFPYIDAGRRYPDSAKVLVQAWRAALAEADRRAGGIPLAATGKSLGGRMASMAAAEEGALFPASALVFFGYPLHPPGRTERRRDSHLASVEVPMLFIQGTSDALARFDLMTDMVAALGPRARLHAVEGADHSFRVRGRKRPDEEVGAEVGGVAAAFMMEGTG